MYKALHKDCPIIIYMRQFLLLLLVTLTTSQTACHYSCDTCSSDNLPTACLTCPTPSSTYHRVSTITGTNECLCLNQYYDDGTNKVCASCDHSCATCNNAIECLTCGGNRDYVPADKTCPCSSAFFDNGVLDCVACDYTCLTCAAASTTCTSCNTPSHRTHTASDTCPCDAHFYDDGSNSMCLGCHYSCATCIASGTCSTCDPIKNRKTTPNSSNNHCDCLDKFYDDGSN